MPRFNRRGQEQVIFVPTLASTTAPSAAAIAAGTDLHPALRAISGFNYTSEDLDVADMSDTWGKTIPGGDTAADSSMTFYEGDDDADIERAIEAALTKGTSGFVVFSPEGTPASGATARVWPVRVKSNNPDETADNAGATFTVGFTIPDPPVLTAVMAV